MSRKNTKNSRRGTSSPRYNRDNVILGETFAYLNFKLFGKERERERGLERGRERDGDGVKAIERRKRGKKLRNEAASSN